MDSLSRLAVISLLLSFGALWHLGSARDIYSDVRFYYDPLSKNFVTVTITKCYVVTLTHVERDHIHSRGAMEDIELKFMRDWLGTLKETRIYQDDTTLSDNIRSWCVNHAHDIFRIERTDKDAQTVVG